MMTVKSKEVVCSSWTRTCVHNAKLTNAHIKTTLAPIIQKIIDSKYVDPKTNSAEIAKSYNDLNDEMKREFQALQDGM